MKCSEVQSIIKWKYSSLRCSNWVKVFSYFPSKNLKIKLNQRNRMICFFCFSGGTCNTLASKWALLSLVSSRRPLPRSILLMLTWRGFGPASLKISKTPMDLHTLMTVSGNTPYSLITNQINYSKWQIYFVCFFPTIRSEISRLLHEHLVQPRYL